MIVFDLKCDQGHVFEAWFRSSDDFADQQTRGYVTCPICGATHVSKQLSAPNVASKSNQKTDVPSVAQTPASEEPPAMQEPAAVRPAMPAIPTEMRQMVRHMKAQLEASATDVGHDFAHEARAIHYGDAEERAIYGQTTPEEAKALEDEGIPFFGLPDIPSSDA